MKKISFALALAGLFASLVPPLCASTFTENFTSDPSADGWQIFGNPNLFQWNSTNQVLDVTWDSTQPNSFFYLPLGQTYTVADGFYLRFDLQLSDATNFNGGMELAIGLLHCADATSTNFSRADYVSPNLCEFDYFPQFISEGTTYPDSVDLTIIDASGLDVYFAYANLTLNAGVTYRVELIHQPGAAIIAGTLSANGQIISTFPSTFNGDNGDFQLDTLAVINYADDGYGDSILAHGTVGNLAFASPLPIGLIQTPAAQQVRFASNTNWVYTVETSADLTNWAAAAPGVFGNGTNLLLLDTNLPAGAAFYRVRADLP